MTAAPSAALVYLLVAAIIGVVVHAYLYRRVLRSILPRASPAARFLSVVGGVTLPLGMTGLLCMNLVPRAALAPILTVSFVWLGILYFLLLPCLAYEIWFRLRGSRAAHGVPVAIGVFCAVASIVQGSRAPQVVERELRLRDWPRDGYRIAHLSDLHVGATLGRSFVADVVARTNAERPDLVVLTGDLVDGSPEDLLPELQPLSELSAPDGVWFVLGNHEYLSRAERWVGAARDLGLHVLRNAWSSVGPFDLVGIDELDAPELSPGAVGADYDRAFLGRDPRRPAIALVHQPRAATELARRGVLLQLSGHTHGGQIAPLGLLAWWDQGCVVGVCRNGELTVHVTAGAGYWGPPMRFFSRAELALLIVRPKS